MTDVDFVKLLLFKKRPSHTAVVSEETTVPFTDEFIIKLLEPIKLNSLARIELAKYDNEFTKEIFKCLEMTYLVRIILMFTFVMLQK